VNNREELEEVASRVREKDLPLDEVGHGISQSIYFSDPAGNGIEVYVDTGDSDQSLWTGRNQPLDLE
jgi:catechol 2,3-dioxygenase